MPGLNNAPKFGDEIHDGDTGYKIEEIHYEKEKKDRKPRPLNEPPKREK